MVRRQLSSVRESFAKLRAWLLLWPGRHKYRVRAVPLFAGVGIGVFVLVTAAAIVTLAGSANSIDNSCGRAQFGCNAGIELIGTIVTVVFAFASLAYWRVFKVANIYRRDARDKPWELFEAIPPNAADRKVIGRDGICDILEKDLSDRNARPQLIIGPIGVGKTALLVRLTERLARQGAIPVPIRLRDAPGHLDFMNLAKQKFLDHVESKVLSDDEGKKIWKKLCDHRRVVVLADGLEEALIDTSAKRSPAIQLALQEAHEDERPLVVTTRPDDELVGVDAAVIRLGPLEAQEVIDHLESHAEAANGDLRSLATKAEIAELPFYMRVAREVSEDLGSMDVARPRLRLRVELLDRWVNGLLSGKLARADTHFIEGDRKATVDIVERIACETLKNHTLEIRYDDLEDSPIRDPGEKDITARVARGIAPVSERLELMERVSGGLRFQHSMVQAYLAARRLSSVLNQRTLLDRVRGRANRARAHFLDDALTRPSRELLISLVICCSLSSGDHLPKRLRTRLLREAQRPVWFGTPTAFDLLAAAYEIDVLLKGEGAQPLRSATQVLWGDSPSERPIADRVTALTPRRNSNGSLPDPWTVTSDLRMVEAKLRAVTRMGEAWNPPAYRALWDVCLKEDNYRVRLHAAQTLGSSRSIGFRAVRDELEEALDRAPRLTAGQANLTATAEDVRRASMVGWILPLFAGSCEEAEANLACDILAQWIALAQHDLHLGVQTSLAQGFKFQANRIESAASGERLVDLAGSLLDHSTWWYSQICLVQALALSSLDSDAATRRLNHAVARLTAVDGHPLVAAAALLSARARVNEIDPPSRYIWIDEAGVAARVGPKTARDDGHLWLPAATGWLSLHPRARQLVGDVLVYLNLIEGGDRFSGSRNSRVTESPDERVRIREDRRRRVRDQGSRIPPCIGVVSHHKNLSVAGTECGSCGTQNGSCAFALCPYPDYEEHPFRGELYETFCRGQQRLVRGVTGAIPAWRERKLVPRVTRRDAAALKEFWKEMERRAKEPMAGAVDV